MIEVTVYKTMRHEYAGFDMSGHAGYDDIGKDIVCAAVSVLVINTLNSIERFTMIRQVVFLMKTAELLNFVSKIIHRMTPHYCWIP